jgi:hypothetical protein
LATDSERGAYANLHDTRWLHIGYDGNLDSITTQITICIWVKSTNTNWTSNNRIMGRGYAWELLVQGSNTAGFASGGKTLVGSSAINDGAWHHIAVTWDSVSGERKLYVDGQLDNQDELIAAAINNYDRYAIGARATGASTAANIYRGYVDDVRVYNSALTAQEIYDIFSPAAPPECVNQPLGDFNDDCAVDLSDFAIFANEWLFCGFWDLDDCE